MRIKFALNYIRTPLIRRAACVVTVFSAVVTSISPLQSQHLFSHLQLIVSVSTCLIFSGESHNFFPFKSVQLRLTLFKDINLCGFKRAVKSWSCIALDGRIVVCN